MRILIFFIFFVFPFYNGISYSVIYNTKTKIYHNHSCKWAKKCTKNCINIDTFQLKYLKNRPCKICDGKYLFFSN